MDPKWLVQDNIDDVDTSEMINQIQLQGMEVDSFSHSHEARFDIFRYCQYDCIVCYGSIDFARHARRFAKFVPGVWCNFDNLRCSTYYAYYGRHLLNEDYNMMPIGDLLRHMRSVGEHSFFVRPDSGDKPFTGEVIRFDEEHRIRALVGAVGPETLVVVSQPKEITAEWRFVVCDGKVISGCQYLPVESPDYPELALLLATKIAEKDWQPDLCYTVDIAKSGGMFSLLEINSFSCAGFYCCDMENIVGAASLVAKQEWSSYDPRFR